MSFQRFCVPLNEKFKVWGLEAEAISDKEWIVYINKPFTFKGKECVGLNENLLRKARYHGIERLICFIEGKTKVIEMPSIEMIEQMEKAHEYNDQPSNYKDGSPMRIYYFQL